MPVKPPPMQYTCRQCGWKTVHAPKSDALFSMPPRSCGKCGSNDLDATPAGAASRLSAALSSLFDEK